MSSETFEWSSDNPDIVLIHQPQTAVYENKDGSIVIRQESYDGPSEDHYVFITPENLQILIDRLSTHLSPPAARQITHQPARRPAAQGSLLEAAE